MMIVIYKLLLVVVLLNFINSFKFTLHNNINYNNINNDYSINNKNRNSNSNHNDNKMVKKSLSSMIISLSLLSFPLMMNSLPADAIDKSTVTIYKSGKSPKQEDPNDPKKGTKKETSFLRCLSNCKADCQKPGEGVARLDCQQDCQDQCCNSYEQCSFKVKTRTTDI